MRGLEALAFARVLGGPHATSFGLLPAGAGFRFPRQDGPAHVKVGPRSYRDETGRRWRTGSGTAVVPEPSPAELQAMRLELRELYHAEAVDVRLWGGRGDVSLPTVRVQVRTSAVFDYYGETRNAYRIAVECVRQNLRAAAVAAGGPAFQDGHLYQAGGGASGIFFLCGKCIKAGLAAFLADPAAYRGTVVLTGDLWTLAEEGEGPNAADGCDDCGLGAQAREETDRFDPAATDAEDTARSYEAPDQS